MPLNSTRGAGSAKGFGFTGESGPAFVEATGGTVTTVGNYKVHTFTGPGTFTVTSKGSASGSNTVDYLVVAGGGGTDAGRPAGAGAGGFRESVPSPAAWTASPLANPGGGLTVSKQDYPITVGAGGAGANPPSQPEGTSGNPSIFSTITSAGGGSGLQSPSGTPGGSGGGSWATGDASGVAGAGNTPPVSPPQGQPGGTSSLGAPYYRGGGGGGAGAAGSTGNNNGAGGNGVETSINNIATYYAGGGGGGTYLGQAPGPSPAGLGGGGAGNNTTSPPAGNPGTANTGGGGGGATTNPTGGGHPGGSGGSGIVILRYKFQ